MDNPQHPRPDTSTEDKAARRALMLHNLDAALASASALRKITAQSFPGAAATLENNDLSNLSVDERIAMGNQVAAELGELAFNLDPSSTIDSLEPELAENVDSWTSASSAILKAQAPRSPK